MSSEKEFFLRILADHINARSTQPRDGLEWAQLQQVSRSHQVDGIVYFQCRDFMPEPVRAAYEQAFGATLFYYKNRERAIREMSDAFLAAGIPFLTVKGIEVAQCYPIPALRTMGDVDILVHRKDKERAGTVLTSLGFRIGEKNPDYDWAFSRSGLQFELHHHLLYREETTQESHARFFNDYWNHVREGRLDWSFHFLYLLVHLRKHLMIQGAGFRMFMDLAAVMLHEELDWSWMEEKLCELEMHRFALVCFRLIESWFDVRVPMPSEPLDEGFVETATEQILANGIFGYDDQSNSTNSTVNSLTGHGKNRALSRIRMFFRSLFPSYNGMANSPYYRFIRGRPWLLPAGWVYRFWRLSRGKTSDAGSILRRVMTPGEIIDAREKQLRQWGLAPEKAEGKN